jgi:hypothetical protein
MLIEWVASGPDSHDLQLYDRNKGEGMSTDQTKRSSLGRRLEAKVRTGRLQAVRGSETPGTSRKSMEVTAPIATSQDGATERAVDIPG